MTRFWLTASALAIASTASAQEVIELEAVTVYANQTPIAVADSGSTVEIAEAEEIEASPSTTVADFLATLPGISVSANGGIGGVTRIRIRGLSTTYVPVLINGIDVTDPSLITTSYDWGNLALGAIDRIEVVKGSQSAVYGSEAVGGVINISTLNPDAQEGTHGKFGVEFGANNTQRLNFGISTNTDRSGVALTFSHVTTDGYSASSAGTEEDGYQNNQLTLEGYYDVTDTLRVGASLFYLTAEGDFDPFGGDGFPPYDQTFTTETQAARVYAQLTTGAVAHELSYTSYVNDRTSTSYGRTDPFQGTRDKLAYKGVWEASEALKVSFGADWTREGFETTEEEYLFDPVTFAFLGTRLLSTTQNIETTGVFAEANWQPNDALSITGSLRHDDHSVFGGFTSARLALAYDFGNDVILRGAMANGFRAPSLYQLHSQLYGNPNLDPETSRSYELGLEKTYANGFARATLFYTEIDDLIDYSGTGYNQIVGTSVSKGLELSGEYQATDRVTLFGNYTLSDTEGANGQPLPRTPRHDLTLGLNADLTDALSMGVTVQHVADRPVDGFPARKMEDFTLVNLSMSYDIAPQTEAYLRVENLTDEKYQTTADYNASGRAAFFGIRASF